MTCSTFEKIVAKFGKFRQSLSKLSTQMVIFAEPNHFLKRHFEKQKMMIS